MSDKSFHSETVRAINVMKKKTNRPDGIQFGSDEDHVDIIDVSFSNPEDSSILVDKLLKLFEKTLPDLAEVWLEIAIYWSISCSIEENLTRYLHIIRYIIVSIPQLITIDLIVQISGRLSSCIGIRANEFVEPLSNQLLATLHKCLQSLTSQNIVPLQLGSILFWSFLCGMMTAEEDEYKISLEGFSFLISKIDINQQYVRDQILSFRPAYFKSSFIELQSLILRGLASAYSFEISIKLLLQLLPYHNDPLFYSGSGCIFSILGIIPYLLKSFDFGGVVPTNSDTAFVAKLMTSQISKIFLSQNMLDVSKLFDSLEKSRFKTSTLFLKHFFNTIKSHYLPRLEVSILIFLLRISTNTSLWYKLCVYEMIKILLQITDVKQKHFLDLGGSLLTPILLSIENGSCHETIDVLDDILKSLYRKKEDYSPICNEDGTLDYLWHDLEIKTATGWTSCNISIWSIAAKSSLLQIGTFKHLDSQ